MERRPEIRVFADLSSFYSEVADLVMEILAYRLRHKDTATFVLSGGNTPRRLFEILAKEPRKSKIDWRRVDFLWSDERCVGPEDPQSNFGMASHALLSKIDVPPHRLHRIRGEMDESTKAASEYEQEIRDLVRGDTICLDLVLLGMGAEGHTASLFPETTWDEERLVVAVYVPKLKSYRISMTPRLLNSAAAIVFLVAGQDKALTVSEVLRDPPGDLPAARIQPTNGRLIWLLDEQAASRLKGIEAHPRVPR